MKKFIISFLIGLAIGAAIDCFSAPACVTNVILSSLQPGGFSVVGALPFTAHDDGTIEGTGLLAEDCDLGPVITMSIDYSEKPSNAAILSWECEPACGDGGAIVIRAPSRAAAISFRIFISGQCQLSYCIVRIEYYVDPVVPNRFFPYVW